MAPRQLIEGKDYLEFRIELGDLWQVLCTTTHTCDSYWAKEADAHKRLKQLRELYGKKK